MQACMLIVFTYFCFLLIASCENIKKHSKFPDNFKFGVASSSYQIEGAWNVNGKGPSIWDTYTHTSPSIIDHSTGDVSSDSYHHLHEDVDLIHYLGVDFYRFSLSWPRILPYGYAHRINPDGLRYYNELIDALLFKNITPMVTMYHWDLPQKLQDIGGWTNEYLVKYYVDYARVVFDAFGDKVKYWITFNEPTLFCLQGYGMDTMAPGLNVSGIAEYLCGHTVLKAHAKVYYLYDEEYRPKQNGNIFITVDGEWYEASTTEEIDIQATRRMMQFTLGWFSHPIFSEFGDYPDEMKEAVALRSKAEGLTESRLPVFSNEEIEYIKGTSDFFGVNHYTTNLVKDIEAPYEGPHFLNDLRALYWQNESWTASCIWWLKVVPWGFRKVIKWIRDEYGDVAIYITENGYSDSGGLNDQSRINYYELYLRAMLEAIYEDGADIKCYTCWSLLDSFEWSTGYTAKFGLYRVNFQDPERPRTPKASAQFIKDIIATKRLPSNAYKSSGTLISFFVPVFTFIFK